MIDARLWTKEGQEREEEDLKWKRKKERERESEDDDRVEKRDKWKTYFLKQLTFFFLPFLSTSSDVIV